MPPASPYSLETPSLTEPGALLFNSISRQAHAGVLVCPPTIVLQLWACATRGGSALNQCQRSQLRSSGLHCKHFTHGLRTLPLNIICYFKKNHRKYLITGPRTCNGLLKFLFLRCWGWTEGSATFKPLSNAPPFPCFCVCFETRSQIAQAGLIHYVPLNFWSSYNHRQVPQCPALFSVTNLTL